ncbi:MAG: hypothetical protein ACRC2K_11680 [Clostridium sp.]
MKLLITDMDLQTIQNILGDMIKEFKVYTPENTKISACVGCFNCWVNTVGQCVIKDMGREIAKEYMKSDRVYILTKITYGGYDVFVKNVLDRLIPNIHPFFEVVNNEIHHRARYEKYPSIRYIGFGECTKEEKVLFLTLTKANGVNFKSKDYKGIVAENNDEIKMALEVV